MLEDHYNGVLEEHGKGSGSTGTGRYVGPRRDVGGDGDGEGVCWGESDGDGIANSAEVDDGGGLL